MLFFDQNASCTKLDIFFELGEDNIIKISYPLEREGQTSLKLVL
jgi:hypothetical protein